MKKNGLNLCKIAVNGMLFLGCAMFFADASAAVVSRGGGTSARAGTVRGNTTTTGSRSSVSTSSTSTASSASTTTSTASTTTPTKEEPSAPMVVEDQSASFKKILDKGSSTTSGETDMARRIRQEREREALRVATEMANNDSKRQQDSMTNACDATLRECMTTACGQNFTKCANDRETDWNNKMNSCRLKTKCSGTEYTIFANEIKADRDAYKYIAEYNDIVNCGDTYRQCIVNNCGATFTDCLGKAAGDHAIAMCAKQADACKEQDSGLAARMMDVFGTLRVNAEKQIQEDERRLYALRDEMASVCKGLGAMFDERTMNCVFTVNFWAGTGRESPFASKKVWGGNQFDCTQGWFGVDVTTYLENAMRLERNQAAAVGGAMGGGIGMGAGIWASGAAQRGIETQQAKRALNKAKNEETDDSGVSASGRSGSAPDAPTERVGTDHTAPIQGDGTPGTVTDGDKTPPAKDGNGNQGTTAGGVNPSAQNLSQRINNNQTIQTNLKDRLPSNLPSTSNKDDSNPINKKFDDKGFTPTNNTNTPNINGVNINNWKPGTTGALSPNQPTKTNPVSTSTPPTSTPPTSAPSVKPNTPASNTKQESSK